MTTVQQQLRSSTAGVRPTAAQCPVGALFINYTDGVLCWNDGTAIRTYFLMNKQFAPKVVSASTYTVLTLDGFLIFTVASTVTLPAASATNAGRAITIKNTAAVAIISASSNVKPIGSATAGTAILAATAGKFATLVSDGSFWIVMEAN